MAIADQITRLQNAKQEIKTSIINKGVSVADTEKLDNYNTLIDKIATDTTASVNDILFNKTAYINGKKETGQALAVQTSASNSTILSGFTAYSNTGEFLQGTYKPLQVQTGAVSETDNVYTINTTFTPKGFVMFSDNISESAARDYVFCLFDLAGTKTVTGYCTYSYKEYLYQNWLSALGNVDSSNKSALVSNYIYNYDAAAGDKPSDVHFNPYLILDDVLAGSEVVSKLELGMSNANSQIVDVYGSDYLLWDALYDNGILDGVSEYTDEYTNTNNFEFTTATVSYSSTGAIITVPTEIIHEDVVEVDEVETPITFTRQAYCNKMNYIIWGE